MLFAGGVEQLPGQPLDSELWCACVDGRAQRVDLDRWLARFSTQTLGLRHGAVDLCVGVPYINIEQVSKAMLILTVCEVLILFCSLSFSFFNAILDP